MHSVSLLKSVTMLKCCLQGFTPSVRKLAWPYLLGVVPWGCDKTERDRVLQEKQNSYATIKHEWEASNEVYNREDVVEVCFPFLIVVIAYHSLRASCRKQERHRIDVDCRRTDRTQPLFMVQANPDGTYPDPADDDGSQSRSNEHVDRMGEILLTYNFYEKELGMWRGTRLFSLVYFEPFGD